jgi:hypothetical protein
MLHGTHNVKFHILLSKVLTASNDKFILINGFFQKISSVYNMHFNALLRYPMRSLLSVCFWASFRQSAITLKYGFHISIR